MASDAETVSNVLEEQGNVGTGERAALKYSSPEAPPGVPKPDKQSPYGRQLLMGQEVEKEHKGTINWLKKNPDAPLETVTRSIASDHIPEDKKYYTHLKEMEEKYKQAMWTGLFDEIEQIKEAGIFSRTGEAIQQHFIYNRALKDINRRAAEARGALDVVKPSISRLSEKLMLRRASNWSGIPGRMQQAYEGLRR